MAEQLQASHETLELRVEERTQEVRRLLQERTEFFAGLSHELRTPLAIIIAQSEMLLDGGVRPDRGFAIEVGQTVRESATQLVARVNDILQLAKAEAGGVELELRPVELSAMVGEITSLNAPMIGQPEYLPRRGRMFPVAVKWRVDELARRKGWNARQLAAKARVDIKTARNIITGKATRVDLETIGRLAHALGVDPGALWRQSGQSRADRWARAAGVAGSATKEEMEWVLGRTADEDPDSGLERATRDL